MKHKRILLPRVNAFRRSLVAVAIWSAIASSAVALVPDQTVQITSGFMTVSAATPRGAWMLAGTDLSAGGAFIQSGGQLPGHFTILFPQPLGTSVPMSFVSDSADGWFGQMLFNGVNYNLNGDNAHPFSSMVLDASPVVVGHAGSYMEPFTFSAKFCGFLTVPMDTCDATVNLVGSGTLDLVVVLDPHLLPTAVDFQSVSYQFAGAPEPASIALLLTGLVGLGLTRRRPGARHL